MNAKSNNGWQNMKDSQKKTQAFGYLCEVTKWITEDGSSKVILPQTNATSDRSSSTFIFRLGLQIKLSK